MSVQLEQPDQALVPIHQVDRASFSDTMARIEPRVRQWLAAIGFEGMPNTFALVPAADGTGPTAVWAGVQAAHPYALAALPRALSPSAYRLGDAGLPWDCAGAVLSWHLGAYVFDRYKAPSRPAATLVVAPSPEARRGLLLARTFEQACDLINTPAEDMGPAELAESVSQLAREYGATFQQIVGDDLLQAQLPVIHAVGRASHRPPRLIELNWGRRDAPKLTLVGKGVCYDTGGLSIKTNDVMRMMKKDMGGAAHALALARLVMALEIPVCLQVLIPAVDNAIAGNAYRPGDVLRTRKGLTVEVGNTDAEGRLILCDALAYGAERQPDLMIDLATLTGAARVALGPQLPALYCRDMAMARQVVDLSLASHDALWHLPLWQPYHKDIESPIADLVNIGRGTFAGSVAAALFLQDFVPAKTDWMHIDLFAWNDVARPGRPVGAEVQGVLALLAYLEQRYPR